MKNKKVRILDALQHKELIGDEFEIQYIIKPDGEPPMTIKQLAEKLNGLAEIVSKLIITVDEGFKQMNMRIDNVETEMREGFKQVNARIDNLVKKNNLKE